MSKKKLESIKSTAAATGSVSREVERSKTPEGAEHLKGFFANQMWWCDVCHTQTYEIYMNEEMRADDYGPRGKYKIQVWYCPGCWRAKKEKEK